MDERLPILPHVLQPLLHQRYDDELRLPALPHVPQSVLLQRHVDDSPLPVLLFMEKPPLLQRHVVQLLLPIVPRMEQTLPTRYDVQKRFPVLLPHADLRLLLLDINLEAKYHQLL